MGLVIVYGHFSSIHAGHLRYLEDARRRGDRLLVAVIDDSGKRFRFKAEDRVRALEMLSIVDEVYILENKTLAELIRERKPDYLVLGREHKDSPTTDVDNAFKAIKEIGGQLAFHGGETYSTMYELLGNSEKGLVSAKIKAFNESCRRENVDIDLCMKKIEDFSNVRLLVLGDTIVDQYMACDAVGISAEAPVIVVKERFEKNFVGGAAVVATHVAALGAKCCYLSVVGDDSIGKFVQDRLESSSIETRLVVDPSRPTTFKKRYLVENQKVFRVSKFDNELVSDEIEARIIATILDKSDSIDAIVVSDFVYGVITPNIIRCLMEVKLKKGIRLYGDLQCSSQRGLVTHLRGFDLICPNEKEARYALQDDFSSIERICQELISRSSCENLLMKLGSEGIVMYAKDDLSQQYCQPFPSLATKPIDVTGAGDSMLAFMAVAMSAKWTVMESAAISCAMAALAVETLGNKSISKEELLEFCNNRIRV